MTIAEKRVIQFLHKTSLKGSQLHKLVAIQGVIDLTEAKEAVLQLLVDGVVLMAVDRTLSLAPPQEDSE